MPYVIGIAGGSSSGKTSFAKEIKKRLEVYNVQSLILSLDNYYKSAPEGSNITNYNFDHPDALDIDMFCEHLKILKTDISITIPINDFVHNKRVGSKVIEPADIIIVEGLFAISEKCIKELLDISIFIDAGPETRLFRRIKRDVSERGREMVSLEKQYTKYVVPAYNNIIKPSSKLADIIINNDDVNNFSTGVEVICNHIITHIDA